MVNERLDVLDSIRGFAACIVAFIWHYQHFTSEGPKPFENYLKPLYENGWIMVELFFIISGFVMAYGYRDKIASGVIEFDYYMKKRIKHIWPLMFITLLVVLAEELIYHGISDQNFVYGGFDAWHFLLNILMIQYGWFDMNFSFNGPAWCIPVEIFCYILFYLVIKNKKNIYLYTVAIIGATAVYLMGWNLPFVNQAMSRGVICFFLGCLLFEVYSKRDKLRVGAINIVCYVILAIAVCVTYYCKSYDWFGNFPLVFMYVLAPCFLWVAINSQWLRNILEFKGFVALGKCSMSIFLWHFPVQYIIKIIDVYCGLKINYLSFSFFFVYIVAVLVVAVLSRRFIEKKNIDFMKIFVR